MCTLNAARVLDITARLLGVDHGGLSRWRWQRAGRRWADPAPLPGRRAHAQPARRRGTLHGLTTANGPENLARAAVEGVLCSLADAVDQLAVCGTPRGG